ncbi:MAG: redoxin domain-containing protein [Pseudomonadales bacterium]|nr:redoxin domain-containing protein [Pseudomonadales bacterium]
MQLGELQHQIERFERRGVDVVALSVDKPKDSLAIQKRLGISYHLGSDPEQSVVKAFRVQNPDTQELALHAVYILDQDGRIFYRKVARRRPVSNELIDAVDAHLGTYPQTDPVKPRQRVEVAYPVNNFQAILEIADANGLPTSIDDDAFNVVLDEAMQIHSDDALIALVRFMEQHAHVGEQDLLATVNWLTRRIYFPPEFSDRERVFELGIQLRDRLSEVQRLEHAITKDQESDERDKDL